MDDATKSMLEESYIETVQEALGAGNSNMDAHKEGIVAASMLLASLTGAEDEVAKSEVVSLNFRPELAA